MLFMLKQLVLKFCIYFNDVVIILNILDLICENCFYSLNYLEFRKYLFSICYVNYIKILFRMFRFEIEVVFVFNVFVGLIRIYY